MRTQQKIWEEEHKTQTTLPELEATKTSSFVLAFTKFLEGKKVPLTGTIIDIGCGKGRNSIYFASKGLDVFAVDYIDLAIAFAKKQAKEKRLLDKIHFYTHAIDEKWEFKDNYFDFAIDCFSSIDIETKRGRNIYKQELFRTLKPKGYAMVSVVSTHDKLEKELMSKYPGKEKNSVYWPINGKFQKNYDEKELRNFYKEFTIVLLKEISKPTKKLNNEYTATNFLLIIQKP
jgi:SAM-dependent methyltransferase